MTPGHTGDAIREALYDTAYEKFVTGLEREYERRIMDTADLAVEQRDESVTSEEAHDKIMDAVEELLFDDPKWANVKAEDISDIAYEAANLALAR